jgi:hypothetical protein
MLFDLVLKHIPEGKRADVRDSLELLQKMSIEQFCANKVILPVEVFKAFISALFHKSHIHRRIAIEKVKTFLEECEKFIGVKIKEEFIKEPDGK